MPGYHWDGDDCFFQRKSEMGGPSQGRFVSRDGSDVLFDPHSHPCRVTHPMIGKIGNITRPQSLLY